MARIIVESGPGKGTVVHLPGDGRLGVGRESGTFLRLDDAKVSRQHFLIVREGSGWSIADERSSNGTFLNGKRIARSTLRSGDLIRAGDTFLSFLSESADIVIGHSIAGYLVQERIGRGGMGTVYRALQTSLERIVALKLLSPALLEDREFVSRFIREAKTAARLDHPHVVRIYDAGDADGYFFLSMEYMPAGSVQAAIDRDGKLGLPAALSMAVDVAKALVWASENNIVHRDIKPDNLLYSLHGAVKVADFGLASDERRSKTLYTEGRVLGTPAHMAPEQALGRTVDPRSDMYALGSTLYTALTGQVPYPGDNPVEVLLKKVKEPPKPLRELNPDAPESTAALVGRLMAVQPEQRYATAGSALQAIEAELKACLHSQKAPAENVLKKTLRKLRGNK